MTPTPAADTSAGGLLERLMGVVRPEFRVEMFTPTADDPVFFSGICQIPSCPTAVRLVRIGLCETHHSWWAADGRPTMSEWLPIAEQRLRDERVQVPPCGVTDCNRALRRSGLCVRHHDAWQRARGPHLETWTAAAIYAPPPAAEHDCGYPYCPRWADGPSNPFCRLHYRRWRTAGQPDVETWVASLPHRLDPGVDLRGLSRQLRLEIGYGLQCRADAGTKISRVNKLVTAVGQIRAAGVASLLDFDEQQWRAFTAGPRPGNQASRSFILDTRFALSRLLITDPWADQFPRDTWDLTILELDNGIRYLRFDRIVSDWLRDLVKRWARHRLARGLTPLTVNHDLRACAQFADHLHRRAGATAGPAEVTRAVLESWFAALAVTHPNPVTRRSRILSVGVFLRDVQRYGWQPEIPRTALVYDDAPIRPPSKPRWVPEYLMRQLEDPAALNKFPTTEGRLLLTILINYGLRLGDARRLPLDCVVRDDQNAPYLAWVNYKMHQRIAFFPISEDLAAQIADQQAAQRDRFGPGCRWLFTSQQANLDGSKPMKHQTWARQLDTWLRTIDFTDEHGQPARVTAHQFRHTVGTRLINADVPQHVVQQLLDHMSPQMTDVYARLHSTTLRRHWEAALKADADGKPAQIPAEHPLADASWAKISMVRAKVTLPNGYCGAPVQTDCEYANPCLDCRFFITTTDFLAQHRQQRDDTRQAIVDAENTGLARVAEKNRRTAGKLDTIIDALTDVADDEIVVGGHRKSHDAAS